MTVKYTLYLSEEQKVWIDKQNRKFNLSEFVRWCLDQGIENITEFQKEMDEEEKVYNTT